MHTVVSSLHSYLSYMAMISFLGIAGSLPLHMFQLSLVLGGYDEDAQDDMYRPEDGRLKLFAL